MHPEIPGVTRLFCLLDELQKQVAMRGFFSFVLLILNKRIIFKCLWNMDRLQKKSIYQVADDCLYEQPLMHVRLKWDERLFAFYSTQNREF